MRYRVTFKVMFLFECVVRDLFTLERRNAALETTLLLRILVIGLGNQNACTREEQAAGGRFGDGY